MLCLEYTSSVSRSGQVSFSRSSELRHPLVRAMAGLATGVYYHVKVVLWECILVALSRDALSGRVPSRRNHSQSAIARPFTPRWGYP